MSERGKTKKIVADNKIKFERAMLTRHYKMSWDLDKCVSCQIGAIACPKEAISYVEGEIKDGRIAKKPTIDVDPAKCVLCGICEVMCPTHAINISINGKYENPVLAHEAFAELLVSESFDPTDFNWDKKDFVINNCPTNAISFKEKTSNNSKTMEIDENLCIHCRQCEIASKGAFTIKQAWQGKIEVETKNCEKGCFACADICPTRALSVLEQKNNKQLMLADYYCIKCGACANVCPIKDEEKPAITFERWSVNHKPVKSAAWIEAISKLADEKAKQVEIDRKRALKRRDLLMALPGAGK